MVSPRDKSLAGSNGQELKGKSFAQLLSEHTFKELVDLYSLEHLENFFGIDEILKQFHEVKQDTKGGLPGVLSTREIRKYVEEFKLICPFQEKNLRGASYDLSLGDQYALQGKKGKLLDEAPDNELKIPPFQVAIIKTKEILNMPCFLIGRWNIRVRKAYEGLLWVGGPQIDPNWRGHLFCPIYNLSDEDVILEKGEPIATVDFVRTTDFDPKFEAEYWIFPRETAKKTIDDYNWRLKSALFTKVQERMDDIEKKASRAETLSSISLGVIAIMFTALGILVTSTANLKDAPPIWVYFSVALSVFAILLSLRGWIGKVTRLKTKTDKWFYIVVIIYMVLSMLALGYLFYRVL